MLPPTTEKMAELAEIGGRRSSAPPAPLASSSGSRGDDGHPLAPPAPHFHPLVVPRADGTTPQEFETFPLFLHQRIWNDSPLQGRRV